MVLTYSMLWSLDKGELDVDLFEIAQFFLPTIQFMINFIIGSQTAHILHSRSQSKFF
jgi:hypothetical protein